MRQAILTVLFAVAVMLAVWAGILYFGTKLVRAAWYEKEQVR